jgi:hypothetical protein
LTFVVEQRVTPMKTRTVIALILILYGVTISVFYCTAVTTVTLYPNKDSYAWESVPNANNGKSDNFEITSYLSHNMRGWIEFNTSSIPPDAWILSAQLRLRLWQKTTDNPPYGDSTGRIYGVYRVTQPWGEMTVTWTNEPQFTELHQSTSTIPNEQGGWFGPIVWMGWDITDIMKDWQQGIPNYGLIVRDTQENATLLYSTQFFTHDQVPNQGYFPRLVVTYLNLLDVYIFAILIATETSFLVIWITKHRNDIHHQNLPSREPPNESNK